jgi:hypothetical protein
MLGERPSEEIIFAFRMMMLKYNLGPQDILKIMVALDKEKGSGG